MPSSAATSSSHCAAKDADATEPGTFEPPSCIPLVFDPDGPGLDCRIIAGDETVEFAADVADGAYGSELGRTEPFVGGGGAEVGVSIPLTPFMTLCISEAAS